MTTPTDHDNDSNGLPQCMPIDDVSDLVNNAVKGGMMAALRGVAEAITSPTVPRDEVVAALIKEGNTAVYELAGMDRDLAVKVVTEVVADLASFLRSQADSINRSGDVKSTVAVVVEADDQKVDGMIMGAMRLGPHP